MLDSRPTTNGVIIAGKMTTSRMGIIGSLRVSNFSLAVVNESSKRQLQARGFRPQAPALKLVYQGDQDCIYQMCCLIPKLRLKAAALRMTPRNRVAKAGLSPLFPSWSARRCAFLPSRG